VIVLVALALGAVSCGADPSVSSSVDPAADARLTRVVSAFGVSAIVPDDWVVAPADDDAYTIGVSATPGPGVKPSTVPVAQGLLATRVDATAVGAPSDLYYLAAKGPIVAAQADHDARCKVTNTHVYADHAPAAVTGRRASPGDFVASAVGHCRGPRAVTRFSYFIAAPGFGPARERGIPGSGLYLIMASTPAVPGAQRTLTAMIGKVRFGADGAQDFVQAVQTHPVAP
jgi:hypothetical protein